MADVGLALTLLQGIIELAGHIAAAAHAIKKFGDESFHLNNRCRRIMRHMEPMTPYVHLVEEEIKQLHYVFLVVQQFLEKLKNAHTMKKLVKYSKYEQQFKDLQLEIDRAWYDTVMALHIGMPLADGNVVHVNEGIVIPPKPIVDDPDRPAARPTPAVDKTDDTDDDTVMEEEDEDDNLPPPRPFDRTYVEFDFTPAPAADRVRFGVSPSLGSISGSSESRADLKTWCGRIDPLRKMEQSTRVIKIEMVTAKLEEGDTTCWLALCCPIILAFQLFSIVYIVAVFILVLPCLLVTGGPEKLQENSEKLVCFPEMGDVRHFLLHCVFADGTVCTLERCVDDVHLYHDKSARFMQHTVFTATFDADDSIVTLRDLIRLRNVERRRPYNLRTNNCQHFVFEGLKSLLGRPDGLQLQWTGILSESRNEMVTSAFRMLKICSYARDGRIILP